MSSQPAPASKGAQQGYASDASKGQTQRSSRITTPVKRSGMVPASTDSRRSIVFPTAIPNNPSKKRVHSSSKATSEANSTITKAKSQKKSRSNKKSGEPTLINADGKSSIEIIDYAQNSDKDNAKVHNPAKKKNNEFDEIMLFFKAPVYIQTDDHNQPPVNFECKWCRKVVRGSVTGGTGNLRVHRNGSRQAGRSATGCTKRHVAIDNGAKLPKTAQQEAQDVINAKSGLITNHFHPTEKFDNTTFNQIVTLWLIRQAFPWSRVEDPYLRAAFNYCQAAATLFKRKWAANSAKVLYLDLQKSMISSLKANDSKFNLVHDVWTTKGNRHGFIGASVTFIDNNWKYRTTDSASSNNTMARKMHKKIFEQASGSDFSWDYTTMHIKCFCHKIALVVTAGLKELRLATTEPNKTKKSFFGVFPFSNLLATIQEENEDEGNSDSDGNLESEELEEDVVNESEIDEDDDFSSRSESEEENTDPTDDENHNSSKKRKTEGKKRGTTCNKANELDELTKSLDAVIIKITGSSAWRQAFERKAAGKNLKNLIAGYGIRWNIKYQSWKRAYDAREVIDALLKEEYDKFSDQISKSSRKNRRKKLGHFKEVQFSGWEWLKIKELNDLLEPFDQLTRDMEGDGPTGCQVLPQYFQTIATLKKKQQACLKEDALYPMYSKMIAKLTQYQNEALECETLVMATILHPSYCLKLIEVCWPDKARNTRSLLEKHFITRKDLLAEKERHLLNKSGVLDPNPVEEESIFDQFDAPSADVESKELEIYLQKLDPPTFKSKDGSKTLVWWNVSFILFKITFKSVNPFLNISSAFRIILTTTRSFHPWQRITLQVQHHHVLQSAHFLWLLTFVQIIKAN
ncbi:hypothetical protein PTTG_27879 [Puccinia triticina 1-1 BBBD Race 1]|uniref:BED-type domain-containing protein n=1 Tax=Puccinia triticina (isolate 1-1 / race 1 (BBBD)) TaxID=630390 RepID=A0A180GH33_PUCT1|nr:hypothetical protein PTTG_27879 [Puccinia triticina 1-1 BBBD Race 1]